MRGKKAKAIRREIGVSQPRYYQYKKTGQIVRDRMRITYQIRKGRSLGLALNDLARA